MAVRTYDPKLVSIALGTILLEGFSVNQMISVEYDENNFFKRKGARGGFSRTRNASQMGMLTVFLAQTSPSNEALQNAFNADYFGGGATLPLLGRDAGGTSVFKGSGCYVEKLPTMEYGDQEGDREWNIVVPELFLFHGTSFSQ